MNITLTDADVELRTVALQARGERVTLIEGGQEVAVILSPEDYRSLRATNVQALHQLALLATAQAEAAGLTDEKLAELLSDAA